MDALVCSGQAGIKDLSSELVGVVFLRENHSSNHQTNVICIQPCPGGYHPHTLDRGGVNTSLSSCCNFLTRFREAFQQRAALW